jgi:membrane-associated phospholipid phosphatase
MARSSVARLGLFAAGVALVGATGALSCRRDPDPLEVAAFRRVNGMPDELRWPVWVIMLGGTFGAVPASAGVAWLAGRRRLAVHLMGGGTAAYLLAKALKPYVDRGRPGSLLEDVSFRDRIGGNQGWISGHAAVATTLGLTAGPALPPGPRAAVYAWAASVSAGRMYAGAHMPLDVVGGAGLGMMIAALAKLDRELGR